VVRRYGPEAIEAGARRDAATLLEEVIAAADLSESGPPRLSRRARVERAEAGAPSRPGSVGGRSYDLGESLDGLAVALRSLDVHTKPTSECTVTGSVTEEGPFLRALFRAEAELLTADADALAAGRWTYRTPEQRRADAFVLMAERLGAAVKELQKGAASRRRVDIMCIIGATDMSHRRGSAAAVGRPCAPSREPPTHHAHRCPIASSPGASDPLVGCRRARGERAAPAARTAPPTLVADAPMRHRQVADSPMN
jgi:hypothetical protein